MVKKDVIIILGSGESILSLSTKEIAFINKCRYIIALNKYMAFYDKVGIIPNCVYFHDEHENSFLIYRYILAKCAIDGLNELTIYTSNRFKMLSSRYFVYVYLPFLKMRSLLKWYILRKRSWSADKMYIQLPCKHIEKPKKCKIISLKLEGYDTASNWAKQITEPLFNFKGSLSSVLNLCSIVAPNFPIYLVGNDFNGSRYFYQDELDRLGIPWKDYTFSIVNRCCRHMSFIPSSGKTLANVLPLIIEKLSETNNELYCVNNESLLVKEGNVKYKKLPTDE